eukprot:g12840.t1
MRHGSRYGANIASYEKSRTTRGRPHSAQLEGRREQEVPTKDVAQIVKDLLEPEGVCEVPAARPNSKAAMVLQCLEVVLMKLQSESPARLAARLELLLGPVTEHAALEIKDGGPLKTAFHQMIWSLPLQVCKEHRPRLLDDVEVLQERLRDYQEKLKVMQQRQFDQKERVYRESERSRSKLEEGLRLKNLEEDSWAILTARKSCAPPRSCISWSIRSLVRLPNFSLRSRGRAWPIQSTRRQLIFTEMEALTAKLSRLRKEYELEKQALSKLQQEVAQMEHQKRVAALQIADLPEMEEWGKQLEAKRARLQEEMTVLLAHGRPSTRRGSSKGSSKTRRPLNTKFSVT